jgi:hypothetical protein
MGASSFSVSNRTSPIENQASCQKVTPPHGAHQVLACLNAAEPQSHKWTISEQLTQASSLELNGNEEPARSVTIITI